MVVAPIAAGREPALRDLLATMNTVPGMADPGNAVLPFGLFDGLHFARLAILDDPTVGDIAAHGLPVPRYPVYLTFFGDCDGEGKDFLAEVAERASAGLRALFLHCEGFDQKQDLLSWLLAHDCPVAASYINCLGRTVKQVRQERALQRSLSAQVRRAPMASGAEAQQQRRELIAFVDAEIRAGRLQLTPPEATPWSWLLAKWGNLIALPLLGLILLPLLLVALPVLVLLLRRHETRDPEVCPRPSLESLLALKQIEDHDVTNQYTALGMVKPGPFRRGLLTVLLVLVNYGCRHVFNRGHLARVQTIHFARWVFLDNKTRVAFSSNYDGMHEAYMDDFINKVAWGLNLLFSNGVGWPHTDWLLLRGARIEQRFKPYQRRHQLPTQVWYKAYPGLTLADLQRNQNIREGLEAARMSDAQAIAWLGLL